MTILYINSDVTRHGYTEKLTDARFEINVFNGGFDSDVIDQINISKAAYIPTKGDKIYFLPSVHVPRVKFKNVCVEHGIKNVRDINQANVIFGSQKSIHEMTTSAWKYKCTTADFITFFNIIKEDMDEHYVQKVESAFEFYEGTDVAIDYNLTEWILNYIPDSTVSRFSSKMYMVDEKYNEIFNYIIDKVVLDESSVINVLNGEDATVIDQVMFDHLSEMFDSSDTDNHVLAMEIMANSKYVESLIYIKLLFYKFASEMSNSHTKNHVNFKSLLAYLNSDSRYFDTDMDNIVRCLIDKNQFTPDKLDILLKYASEDIQNRGNSKYFSVKNITVNPEFITQLNHNYEYRLEKEFIPTVSEVIEEVVVEEEEMTKQELDILNQELDIEEEILDDLATLAIEEPLTIEPVSNNNQINTNESTDIDWF
jgi:hypothetical protein